MIKLVIASHHQYSFYATNVTGAPHILIRQEYQLITPVHNATQIIQNYPVFLSYLFNIAVYSVKGDEKLVNSGLVFPKGMGPPNGSTSLTLTFEKAGTYDYYCILHPWQKGKVVVQH